MGNEWSFHGHNGRTFLVTLGSREVFNTRGNWTFPHLSNALNLRSTLHFVFSTPCTFHKLPMAHFNDANANRPSTSTSGWSTPHRSLTPVSERASINAPETPTDGRSVHMQWDLTSGSRTSPSPEENARECNRGPPKRHCLTFFSPSPGASDSYDVQTQSNGQMITPSKRFWAVIGPCAKPHDSSIPRRENLPNNPAVSEVSTVTSALRDHICVPSKRGIVWVSVQT